MALCKRKEKHKIESKSGLSAPAIAARIVSIVQMKALSKDGESPANQTN